MRVPGQGEAGHSGGAAGDLLLRIDLAPHPQFRLEGRDLHIGLEVAPWEAALGAEAELPTLDGQVRVRIPAGTSSGRRIRVKGRGYPGGGARQRRPLRRDPHRRAGEPLGAREGTVHAAARGVELQATRVIAARSGAATPDREVHADESRPADPEVPGSARRGAERGHPARPPAGRPRAPARRAARRSRGPRAAPARAPRGPRRGRSPRRSPTSWPGGRRSAARGAEPGKVYVTPASPGGARPRRATRPSGSRTSTSRSSTSPSRILEESPAGAGAKLLQRSSASAATASSRRSPPCAATSA